jgi:hypothetical protein
MVVLWDNMWLKHQQTLDNYCLCCCVQTFCLSKSIVSCVGKLSVPRRLAGRRIATYRYVSILVGEPLTEHDVETD